MVKYPASKYKHDILNLSVLSNYELAINSIQSKKLERLNNTLKSYRKFVAEFPDSNEISNLDGLKVKTETAIKEFNN
jgi:outer membrane protein assembly factor BamD